MNMLIRMISWSWVLGCVALLSAGCQGLAGSERSHSSPAPVAPFERFDHDEQMRLTHEQQTVTTQAKDFQAKFIARQAQRVERHNAQQTARFTAIERNGGLQSTVQTDLAALRGELAGAPTASNASGVIGQIESLQNILKNIAFCATPFIFSEDEFLSTREVTEFVIEPLLSVTIYGCRLGAAPGQVRLIFPSTGETFTLKVPLAHWRDDSIHAILPAQSGRLDQPAQLIVITADGVQTPPLDLQFRATREWTFVDPVAHPNVLFVDCGHNTTTDTCQAVAHEGPPPTLFVAAEGKHFTFCCSSVSGTDRWGLSLNNGWTLMSLVENSDVVSSPDIPQVSFSFAAEGYTTCNFFNRDGRITDYRELASSDPRIQGEVHISWWVDHSCSGIEYAANISIIGPSGVPYWR